MKIININMARAGIETKRDLAKRTGIKYGTLNDRMQKPEQLRLFELKAIAEETEMPDEDIIKIVKGVGS